MPKVEQDAEASTPGELSLDRRSILLSSGVAARPRSNGSVTAEAQAQATNPPPRRAGRRQAQHPRHHGRRRRLVQHQRLPSGHHVREDAEPRQARRRRHDVHRLLRRGQLHGGPGELHHRRDSAAHGPDDRRPGRRGRGHAGTRPARSRPRSRPWATPPASSARTTSAT